MGRAICDHGGIQSGGVRTGRSGFRSARFVRALESDQGPTQGTEEAPFTEAGKARFEKNKPGYGPRAVPPAIGNDPMGTCDPLGIPRLLNTEVISPHQTMEIVQVPGRMIQFFEWHHDWREVFTDGRKRPSPDEVARRSYYLYVRGQRSRLSLGAVDSHHRFLPAADRPRGMVVPLRRQRADRRPCPGSGP